MVPSRIEKEKDYIDKLMAVLLGEATATEQQKKQLAKIDKAWSLLHSGYPRTLCATMLRQEFYVENSQAYKLLRDAELLYGNVVESSLKGKKAVYASNFQRLAREAEMAGDLKTAVNALAKAARIEGAFDKDVTILMNPEDWMAPAEFTFTSDPAVFLRSQQGTQDIDHEEVKDEPGT